MLAAQTHVARETDLRRREPLGAWRDGLQQQDEYMAPLELKEQLIRAHLDKAITAENNQWFINFCSYIT